MTRQPSRLPDGRPGAAERSGSKRTSAEKREPADRGQTVNGSCQPHGFVSHRRQQGNTCLMQI